MVVIVVLALVFACAVYFKRATEHGIAAAGQLQVAAKEFYLQDALIARALAGSATLLAARSGIEASRARALESIEAGSGNLASSDQASLAALRRNYQDAVDEALTFAADPQQSGGSAYDLSVVDPALDVLQTRLAAATTATTEFAEAAKRRSDLATIVSLGLAIAASALQGRRRLSQTRAQQRERSEKRYRTLVDQSADIVVVADRTGAAQYLSPSAERLLAGQRGLRAEGGLLTLAHPDDRELFGAALHTVSSTCGPVVLEVRLADGQGAGQWRTFELNVQDLSADAAIEGLVLTGHDVTDRQRMQQEMEQRALHDTLTGLPNRALLADRFDQALRAAHRDGTAVGLLVIDLDRFKEINDTLGHHYGDELLIQVGPRFARALRESDTIARLGGDEFAVLLTEVSGIDAATEVAHKLQATLTRSFEVEGIELDVEASIGVVVSGEHGVDATTLMQRADIAMYVAKQHSLRVSTYDPAGDDHSPERLALLGDLRRALAHDELILHFQPKVSLSTGEVCGAEALVRWLHPERGLIQPGDFIPLAENTGLIGPLTRHVLDLALAQSRRWIDAGKPLQLAVNLSARNLLDERLDLMVAELLIEHAVPARLLKLEVTESAIMSDPVRAKELLHRLAEQGIEIAIDDFGAGYTSLGQLKNLPVTELKIDLSYVTTMDTDTSNSLIVRSVIELGHNLGLSAVAEGVESAAILTGLTSFTCDVAQGYHLSRPLPAQAFDEWLERWPGLTGLEGVEAATGPPLALS